MHEPVLCVYVCACMCGPVREWGIQGFMIKGMEAGLTQNRFLPPVKSLPSQGVSIQFLDAPQASEGLHKLSAPSLSGSFRGGD